MSNDWETPEAPTQLKITCTQTDCEAGLHYYGDRRRSNAVYKQVGKCKDCNAELVDWTMTKQRSEANISATAEMLKTEWIRHHFWKHHQFSQREVNYALRKGMIGLRQAFEKTLSRICVKEPTHWQYHGTKYKGVIECVQHATATCCPACVEYWHGIEQRTVPTTEQAEYLTNLAMHYFRERFPGLADKGQKVAPIRGNLNTVR
jgi:hypothetical protein